MSDYIVPGARLLVLELGVSHTRGDVTVWWGRVVQAGQIREIAAEPGDTVWFTKSDGARAIVYQDREHIVVPQGDVFLIERHR